MAKTKFITGNFEVVVEGSFNDEQREKAETAALRWILQRDGASKAYVELAGEKNSKGNLALPKDFERDSIPYSEENASAMRAAFTKAMSPYGDFTVSEVTEHVAGEQVGSRKQATAMWEQAKTNPAMVTALGIAADADDETGIEACHKFLGGLRSQKEKAKG